MQLLNFIIKFICRLFKKCPNSQEECIRADAQVEEFTEKVCHIIEELTDLP